MRAPSRSVFVAAVLVTAALVAGAVPAAARESATGPATAKTGATTYVGTVKDVGSLAIVVDADGAFAYLCDSADVTNWFRGTNKSGALDLQAPSGASIAAGVTAKALDGLLVDVDGTATSFKLKPAKGDAGLYRTEQVIDGVGYAAGWVVLPNGKVDGQVSAANLAGAAVLPTPGIVANAPTTVTTVAAPAILGSVAPKVVAAAFPADPPPADQVTVVPFNASQTTTEGSGGGANSGETGGGPPPPAPVPSCKSVDDINKELAAAMKALEEAGLLKKKAIKAQIARLRSELADAERGMNCTLPLK